MNPIARLGFAARRGFGRIVPEPFAVAVGLTLLVFVVAVVRGADAGALTQVWTGGQGVWALLAFTMQMCVMLVLGTALATAPGVARAIAAIIGLARTPRQLVGLTAAVSIGLSLLNWSLTLVCGAVLARLGGIAARKRGWSLHYPLLCAAGYSGMMTWHGGLSGSAPLKAASEAGMTEVLGPELAARVGVLGLEQTLLGELNLVVCGTLLVVGPLLFMALVPGAGDPAAVESPIDDTSEATDSPADHRDTGLLERVENSPFIVWLLAGLLAVGLARTVAIDGLRSVSFNTVNLSLWVAALLAHGAPRPFLAACERGAKACSGVILQFPLYAGIMGMMTAAGLSAALSDAFASAGAGALAVLTFTSAGLLNLFVPSGGGQWAVQGPILMDAALRLGVSPPKVLMAMAYGDQWTNMLQPFWALPLLAITGVRARDLIGYTAIWMGVGGVVIVAALLVIG